jgi:hypothetical protein
MRSQKGTVMVDVQQTLEQYYADIKKEGLLAEFKYLDSSENFFWVPPGYNRALSYDSIAAIIKWIAPSLKSVENSFDTLRIIPLSEELATYTGRLRSVSTDTSGKVTTTQLVETGILIKRPAGWKLLSGQTSVVE